MSPGSCGAGTEPSASGRPVRNWTMVLGPSAPGDGSCWPAPGTTIGRCAGVTPADWARIAARGPLGSDGFWWLYRWRRRGRRRRFPRRAAVPRGFDKAWNGLGPLLAGACRSSGRVRKEISMTGTQTRLAAGLSLIALGGFAGYAL